jgi:hypothetical protein
MRRHHWKRCIRVAIWMHIGWRRHTIREYRGRWHVMRHYRHGWIHIRRVIRRWCVITWSIVCVSRIIIILGIIRFVDSVNFFIFLFSIISILFIVFFSITFIIVMMMSTWFMTWFMTLFLRLGRISILRVIVIVFYCLKFDVWVCQTVRDLLHKRKRCYLLCLWIVWVRRAGSIWIGELKV